MEQVLAFATVLAVFIVALVQLIKKTIKLPRNALPLIGLVAGLAVGAVAYPFTELTWVLRLWSGGLAGLSATGLFELAFKDRPGTAGE
ncbi:holin [Paenibacillus donghaensis]|uniref:Holin n=1 Tax=Paenibacillus donghaensis TaxID=414771 RepID=A0A2Z2KPM6_9BACL|nr:holin [Paenibacillus donghaensis]ASA26515.1 holin [Paenibacillus donghaensis]